MVTSACYFLHNSDSRMFVKEAHIMMRSRDYRVLSLEQEPHSSSIFDGSWKSGEHSYGFCGSVWGNIKVKEHKMLPRWMPRKENEKTYSQGWEHGLLTARDWEWLSWTCLREPSMVLDAMVNTKKLHLCGDHHTNRNQLPGESKRRSGWSEISNVFPPPRDSR